MGRQDKQPPLRDVIIEALSNLQDLRTSLRAHGDLETLREQSATVQSEKETAEAELDALRKQIADDTALAHQARADRERAEDEYATEKRRRATLRETVEALEAKRAELEKSLSALHAL